VKKVLKKWAKKVGERKRLTGKKNIKSRQGGGVVGGKKLPSTGEIHKDPGVGQSQAREYKGWGGNFQLTIKGRNAGGRGKI